MLIGETRVSTDDQNLNLQRDALQAAGCERVFENMVSGARSDRAGLATLMSMPCAGDTVVIWRLGQLEAAKVGLRSLQENIDIASSGGKLVFHLCGALAEFERNLIRERTQAGLVAARARPHRRTAAAPRSAQARVCRETTPGTEPRLRAMAAWWRRQIPAE